MVATAALSMWISNTASVMVMLPIAMSVLAEAKSRGADPQDVSKVGTAVMLSIAYAGNIGGMATPIGTPPNLVYVEMLEKLFPAAAAPSFGNWMMLGVPVVVVFIAVAWLLLTRVVFRLPAIDVMGDSAQIADAAKELGPWRRDELVCGGVFAATALLWMTGSDLKLSDAVIPGWRSALAVPEFKDASVAVCAAALLFVLPSKERPGEALLDWDAVKVLPWGLLLLFGGGFALAAGFSASGLSAAIGQAVVGLEGLPPWLLIGIVCTVMTFTTELTSNTATTTLVLPILGQAAAVLGMDPRALMVPATLSASCAFMMPVATPPNAIVFGSGYIKISHMVRAGLVMNVVGVVIITSMFLLLG
jgi:solute carrier family 13 (sodium-dependent dicarboxylate transporter), member 2/3/5